MKWLAFTLLFSTHVMAANWSGSGFWTSTGGIGGEYSFDVHLDGPKIESHYQDAYGEHTRTFECLDNQAILVNGAHMGTVSCADSTCHFQWEEDGDQLEENWQMHLGLLKRSGKRIGPQWTTTWQDQSRSARKWLTQACKINELDDQKLK